MEIVLASQSPRRRELLGRMGISEFQVIPARGEERAEPGLAPGDLVEALSRQKAEEVAGQVDADALVIGADTVVVLDSQVLGKPKSEAQAVEMLSALSGRGHLVYTGVTVLCRGERVSFHEETEVFFRAMTPGEIGAYVATGEPMDKAGAYGVQGRGGLFIRGIRGDFFNVMGLPICRLGEELARFGFPWGK